MTTTAAVVSWTPPSLGAQIAMGLVFGMLVAIGFAGNILVCIAIYTNKRLRKKENLYFVSLAGADLLLSVLVMPFAAFNDIAGHWLFGEYCKIWMSLDIMCCTCSILHLCTISFDRYYHINDPLLYSERMTGRKIFAAILGVWTLSAAIAFVPLSFDTHFNDALIPVWNNSTITLHQNGQQYQTTQTSTPGAAAHKSKLWNSLPDWYSIGSNGQQRTTTTTGASSSIMMGSSANTIIIANRFYQCSFNLGPIYAIISSCVSFYLPSVIMIAAYTKLYRYAQRHAQTIRHQMQAASSLLMNTTSSSPEHPPPNPPDPLLQSPVTSPPPPNHNQNHQSNANNHLLKPPLPTYAVAHSRPSSERGKQRRRSRGLSMPHIGQYQNAADKLSPSDGTGALPKFQMPATPTFTKRRELISSDSKARVTLGAIVGTFLFSWLPFFVCNIIRAFRPDLVPDWLFLTLTWMGYANSAQNPIIYSIFNRDFRYAFRKILLCNERRKRSACGGGGAMGYGGSATMCSVTGADDLVIVNGHAATSLMTRKSSDYTYFSGSTAV